MKVVCFSILITICLAGCNLAAETMLIPSETPPPTRTLPFQAASTANLTAESLATAPVNQTVIQDDSGCQPRTNWEEYTIQSGDNLTRVARLTRSTVAELIAANCLDEPDRIRVGQTIFVPNLPEN